MKKPTLQIDLDVKTLVGCVDILEGFGQPIYNKDFSSLVTEVLNGIILGYQKDGQITVYADEAILGTRFLEILEDLGTLPESNQQYIQEADVDFAIAEVRQKEEEDAKNQLATVKQPLLPLNTEVTDEKTEESSEDGNQRTIKFEDIPDKDSLKQKASTDLEKLSLAFLYTNIPPDVWGTEKAEGLWRRTISNFEKKFQMSKTLVLEEVKGEESPQE